jgi:hypothetical protein
MDCASLPDLTARSTTLISQSGQIGEDGEGFGDDGLADSLGLAEEHRDVLATVFSLGVNA